MNMRTNNSGMLSCVVVLCFGLTWAARAGDPASDPLPFHDEEIVNGTQSSEGMPAEYNRASSIVGMEVRNHRDEYLGRIKDVVFDLNTERVSYAVIRARTGSWLSPRQKLLAVPVNALTASADGKHLVLAADKSKVKMAMGFDQNHWPSVESPSWGAEPFWRADTDYSGIRGRCCGTPKDGK